MNLEIEAEHVAMQAGWYRAIERWVERCGRQHPAVVGIEVTLRHDDAGHPQDEVDAIATGRSRRRLRATARAGLMDEALHDALSSLEQYLLVQEALGRLT